MAPDTDTSSHAGQDAFAEPPAFHTLWQREAQAGDLGNAQSRVGRTGQAEVAWRPADQDRQVARPSDRSPLPFLHDVAARDGQSLEYPRLPRGDSHSCRRWEESLA